MSTQSALALRETMKRRGLNDKDVAAALTEERRKLGMSGVAPSTVRVWLNCNRHPSGVNTGLLYRLFGTQPDGWRDEVPEWERRWA